MYFISECSRHNSRRDEEGKEGRVSCVVLINTATKLIPDTEMNRLVNRNNA